MICEQCGVHIRKKWAVRIAQSNDRRHRGPLYFCNDDCREDYREFAPGREIRSYNRYGLDGTAGHGVEYGESPSNG
ncbi:hypothetical protein HacjB3_05520 [Halalkalicoccus jeotgali B3]|uniref:Uncharacterized protein n=1 Tax=Halalkalicoccus jeotgali (strain DSM 18796 / CECT 7217 / JCM 14584 / KCTC 4019 / B3) TaxID=795797 RepID=D8J9X3_HALJB|nr:hypothetical protein HacjB3_05520 [Halalkalicoccus jeotgali B3]